MDIVVEWIEYNKLYVRYNTIEHLSPIYGIPFGLKNYAAII